MEKLKESIGGLIMFAIIIFVIYPYRIVADIYGGAKSAWAWVYHWWITEIANTRMKFYHVDYIFYYDQPTLFRCRDEDLYNHIFALLDEEKATYVGIPLTSDELSEFMLGNVDLRTLFIKHKNKFYVGEFEKGGAFYASVCHDEMDESMLPAEGLILK